VLSGCTSAAPSADPTTTGNAVSPTPTEALPGPTPDASPTAGGAVTCDSMIVSDTLAEFKTKGWTAKQTPFTFETQPPSAPIGGGLICTWANFRSPRQPDRVRLGTHQLGRCRNGVRAAREEAGAAKRRVRLLHHAGSVRVITVDDKGYGMTYLFGDGWVAVSDTKQNLLLMPATAG
jgi:hypothetical protein